MNRFISSIRSKLLPIGLVVILAMPVGCTTHAKRIANLRNSFHNGDLESANTETEKLLKKSRKDQTLVQMDESLLRLAEGKPNETEVLLRQVRDQFVAPDPLSEIGKVSSYVLDDQSRSFQPDDYEQLFVLMYLAISNLVQNGDDAYAYANQIADLQQKIDRKLANARKVPPSDKDDEKASAESTPTEDVQPVKHKQIALAPYIAAILHEQTHRDYDTAERYYQKTLEYYPSFREGILGLQRVQTGRHSEKGNGVLHVFVAVGKGPFKVEKAEVPTSHAMLIADRILSAVGDHTLPPTLAPIKTARVVVPKNEVQTVRVLVDSKVAGETETVTDLGQIALEQDRAKQDLETARAIVRRIVKKSAIYAGKDALGTDSHSWTDLLINLGGVLWEASESADTRCWGLLPEKIQVLRIELPVGTHDVNLIPIGGYSTSSYSARVEIQDGSNSYLFANFPTANLTGKILVSSR